MPLSHRRRPTPPARPGVAILLVILLTGLLCACAPGFEGPRLPGDRIGPATPAQAASHAGQLARMGRTALARGEAAAAAKFYEQALLADGGNAEALIGLGDAYLRLSRPQEAGEVYARAFGTPGAAAHLGYARAMIALNRPKPAIEHAETALARTPTDPAAHNALGVARDMAGQHAAATAAYRRGLELAPGDPALSGNLGLSLALAGDHQAAIATLRPLAEGARSDKRARQNLALAYGLKGDIEAAARLSRLDLDESDVRNNMAIFAALRGLDSASAAASLAPLQLASIPPKPPRRAAPAPAAERAPVPLAAVALAEGDLSVGASPAGSWFLNLGRFPEPEAAARRWLELRRRHPRDLGGLSKLAGAGGGPEPLLVGPALGEREARTLCGRVKGDAPDCIPVKL